MNPAENEGQIDAFLARTPGASLEKQWQSTPDAFGSDLMYGAIAQKSIKRDERTGHRSFGKTSWLQIAI